MGALWDLNELNIKTRFVNMKNKNQRPLGTSIVLDKNYEVVTGWSDGFILIF